MQYFYTQFAIYYYNIISQYNNNRYLKLIWKWTHTSVIWEKGIWRVIYILKGWEGEGGLLSYCTQPPEWLRFFGFTFEDLSFLSLCWISLSIKKSVQVSIKDNSMGRLFAARLLLLAMTYVPLKSFSNFAWLNAVHKLLCSTRNLSTRDPKRS